MAEVSGETEPVPPLGPGEERGGEGANPRQVRRVS